MKLWFNGKIYTMEKEKGYIDAVVTEGTVIVATGTRGILEQQYPIKEYEDLQGNVMLPGLVDSHIHLIGHGDNLLRVIAHPTHKCSDE